MILSMKWKQSLTMTKIVEFWITEERRKKKLLIDFWISDETQEMNNEENEQKLHIFRCSKFDKAFEWACTLRKHEKIIANERPLTFSMWDQTF